MKEIREIRWGIMGAGHMAAKFASDLPRVPGARLAAVGSLSLQRAEAVAQPYSGARAFGSYEALAASPDVDIIYVATRNPRHCPCTYLALNSGKPVLCEKPFALNASEARQMIDLARERKLFLMEAMWTRFFPAVREMMQLIQAGAIGQPRMINVNFGYAGEPDPKGRLLNPALGGGTLMDVGVYAIALANMLFGSPDQVRSFADMGATGVDEALAILMQFAGGQLATCNCSITLHTFKEADIIGTTGRFRIHEPCWKPHTVSLIYHGKEPRVFSHPYHGLGYQFEIAEVMRCLREGLLECPIMPLNDTLAVMEIVDACRDQWKHNHQQP
jgi:predicted dehydrogenase